jgi:putative transposase
MKFNPTRYSSAVGEAWMHTSFKVKYCHRIFDILEVRTVTKALIIKACNSYGIAIKNIGLDSDHVHMIINIGNYSRPQVAKMIKGYVAKKLFLVFPWLKNKYFWGSGLWSPAYYMYSVGRDIDFMENYVMKQRYSLPNVIQDKVSRYF